MEEEKNLHQIPMFLGQLQYPGMPDRHERITEAHEKRLTGSIRTHG